MGWDWAFAAEAALLIAAGLGITILATVLGSLLAIALGLAFALGVRSRSRAVRASWRAFVDFVRGTPLLVQIYFLFYVLPDAGVFLPALLVGILGLGVHYGAYLCEVFRAGIENVPRGQWEAGVATNLTSRQITWRIILPQAIPPMLPTVGNYVLSMFKETPLLSVITVVEIMSIARGLSNAHYRYLEPITIVGVYFLVLSLPCALLLSWLERRLARSGGAPTRGVP